MSTRDAYIIVLQLLQACAAMVLLFAWVRALTVSLVLPSGPYRRVFLRLGLGSQFLGLMGLSWCLEESAEIFDQITDVCFAVGIVMLAWGLMTVLTLHLRSEAES